MKRKNTNAPGILPALRRTAAYLKKSLPLIIVALVLAMLGTALTIVGGRSAKLPPSSQAVWMARSTLPPSRASACCW